jgi:hypothetical protein
VRENTDGVMGDYVAGQTLCGKPEVQKQQHKKTQNIGKKKILDGNNTKDTKQAHKTKNAKRNKKSIEKKKRTHIYTYETKSIETKNAKVRYF